LRLAAACARGAVSIAPPAPRVAAARLWLRSVPQQVSLAGLARALAAGVNWTCRTANAPWAVRPAHTSVVDAAGAIYVIGGAGYPRDSYTGTFQDVWVSADGGAPPDSVKGEGGGYSRGH
jgi:hypothetical protein